MSHTSHTSIWSHALRVADLPQKQNTAFDLSPAPETIAAIADDLSLLALRKLRFHGHLSPLGASGWQLKGQLGATVEQPCIVTLDPVTTRIDETVLRQFLPEIEEYEAGSEVQMPDDDSIEALGATIDLGEIMVEALALALPLYPKAENAESSQKVFAEPGLAPMTDEDARPFAGLKALKDRLEDNKD